MPVDPRLNCAAEICCHPPMLVADSNAATNAPADKALSAVLLDLGVHPEDVAKVVANMRAVGLVILTAELAAAIRHIAFPESGG